MSRHIEYLVILRELKLALAKANLDDVSRDLAYHDNNDKRSKYTRDLLCYCTEIAEIKYHD